MILFIIAWGVLIVVWMCAWAFFGSPVRTLPRYPPLPLQAKGQAVHEAGQVNPERHQEHGDSF